MRTLSVVFVLLFPFFALAEDSEQGAAKHDAAMPVNRLGNEVRLPDPYGWHGTGAYEVQLTPSSQHIAKTDKSLPVTVWFRNPTDKPASVRCIAGHSFNPHGRLRVTGPKGEEVLGGQCLEKHAMQKILLNPGQVRGFVCDAFSQCCYRKPAGDLAPGKYLLEFMGAKASVVVEAEVQTSSLSNERLLELAREYAAKNPKCKHTMAKFPDILKTAIVKRRDDGTVVAAFLRFKFLGRGDYKLWEITVKMTALGELIAADTHVVEHTRHHRQKSSQPLRTTIYGVPAMRRTTACCGSLAWRGLLSVVSHYGYRKKQLQKAVLIPSQSV